MGAIFCQKNGEGEAQAGRAARNITVLDACEWAGAAMNKLRSRGPSASIYSWET